MQFMSYKNSSTVAAEAVSDVQFCCTIYCCKRAFPMRHRQQVVVDIFAIHGLTDLFACVLLHNIACY